MAREYFFFFSSNSRAAELRSVRSFFRGCYSMTKLLELLGLFLGFFLKSIAMERSFYLSLRGRMVYYYF